MKPENSSSAPDPVNESAEASNSPFWSFLNRWFPALDRADRLQLVETLTKDSGWSVNFGMMLGCSVIIAGLGLLQDSVAVIIGAMLVAPLMTPLIGIGLSLVQGNFQLLGRAARAMLIGTAVSLVLGVLLRWVTPGEEITTQISIRGVANILDLEIAFFAGVAAGYAMARPRLSGALPGVAIAVALVPPLTAAGIAFGSGALNVGLGALLLYLTNMVAIVLGSALVFRINGIRTSPTQRSRALTMKRIILSLGVALVVLAAPLGWRLLDQLKTGQMRPASLSLSEDLWQELDARLEEEDGIDFLVGFRASSVGPEDVTLIITADRVVPEHLMLDLDRIIDRGIGTDIDVKVSVLQQGSVETPPDLEREKGEFLINQ